MFVFVFGVLVAFVAPVPSPCVIYSSPAAFATASSTAASSSLSSSLSSSWLSFLLLLLCSCRSLCFISCWRQPCNRNLTLCSLRFCPQHIQGFLMLLPLLLLWTNAKVSLSDAKSGISSSSFDYSYTAVACRTRILWVVEDTK